MPLHPYFIFLSWLTSWVHQGDIKSIYSELARDGSKNECASTDTVFFPISQGDDPSVIFKTKLVIFITNPVIFRVNLILYITP